MEFFDEMSRVGLSPNQYYLLCCLRDEIAPLKINVHLEIRLLIADKWLTEEKELTSKSIELIQKLEKLFRIAKTRTSTQLLGDDYKANIAKYGLMFPAMKLPSGKAARGAPENLEKAFKWFFENYNYSWDLIFKATEIYLVEQQRKNWKFCRTAQYFIRKDNLSDLGDLCYTLSTGGHKEEHHHSIKVV